MKWFAPIFILSALIAAEISAQKIPDYKERSFTVYKDSTRSALFNIQGTEGVINPDEYMVGPGDIFFLSISGIEENSFTIPVDNEGNIYIPKVGGINVKNNSLAQARAKLNDALNRYFKNVDIFITLAEFKKIKVSLIGDVIKPATFILPGNSRLLDLITVSAGLNQTSNYRNIKIISRDSVTDLYDLLSFLRYGNRNQNPYLREGDVVIIDKVDKIVSMSGLVKYPGSYEYRENETVDELISLGGGLLNKARKDSIEIISFEPAGRFQVSSYYSYDQLKRDKVIIKPQDHIVIRQIPEYLVDRYITITGFIKYPGFYKIVKDKTTLYDIIQEAGGFKEDASLTEATITRNIGTDIQDPEFERLRLIPRAEMTDDEYDYLKAKSRQRKGKVVVDFSRLFEKHDMNENILMIEGDVIDVPQKKNFVVLLGQVVSPGNIIYNPSYTYEDYINLAGGYGWRALESEVRIVRANTGEWVYADDTDEIRPGDAIWVPEDPPGPKFWTVFTTSLSVLGQVAAIIAAIVAVVIASR